MGPSLPGESGVVGPVHTRPFQAQSAFSPKGEHVWIWFPALANTYKASVPRLEEAAETLLGPRASRYRGETGKRCFPEQTRIGAEVGFPRRVSLSRMQLPEASFVPFLRWALGGSLPTWRKRGSGASAHKAFSGPIRLLPKRRARLDLVSSSSEHLQSISAQVGRGSRDTPWP